MLTPITILLQAWCLLMVHSQVLRGVPSPPSITVNSAGNTDTSSNQQQIPPPSSADEEQNSEDPGTSTESYNGDEMDGSSTYSDQESVTVYKSSTDEQENNKNTEEVAGNENMSGQSNQMSSSGSQNYPPSSDMQQNYQPQSGASTTNQMSTFDSERSSSTQQFSQGSNMPSYSNPAGSLTGRRRNSTGSIALELDNADVDGTPPNITLVISNFPNRTKISIKNNKKVLSDRVN